MTIDVELPRVEVLGSEMAYRASDDANNPVALFLHGNPTSSYIWRNIIPIVSPEAYCVAPDLIGFGQSGKPSINYRFSDHARYLDAFIEQMGISSAYLIAQDWGTALAFDLAARHPGFVRGLVFMEFVRPYPAWEDFLNDEKARRIFQKYRTPELGEKLLMEENAFVERMLPAGLQRKLSEDEMNVYRAPFPTPESRKPIWRFPNEIPIANDPPDVYDRLSRAQSALIASKYPKVLIAAEPGALITPPFAQEFAQKLSNCRLIKIDGIHYLQEDDPELIGEIVQQFISENENTQ